MKTKTNKNLTTHATVLALRKEVKELRKEMQELRNQMNADSAYASRTADAALYVAGLSRR
jgi:hypothetical protein